MSDPTELPTPPPGEATGKSRRSGGGRKAAAASSREPIAATTADGQPQPPLLDTPPAAEEVNPSIAAEPAATDATSGAGAAPRFHFFVIDSGWNSAAANVLRENFHLIHEFRNHDPLFELSREQSIALLRKYPDLIGKDPILCVHDLHAQGGRGPVGYHGFRLCLGLLTHPGKALAALQEFLRFIAIHRHSPDIERDIRDKLHHDGLVGAIEVIRESAGEAVAG